MRLFERIKGNPWLYSFDEENNWRMDHAAFGRLGAQQSILENAMRSLSDEDVKLFLEQLGDAVHAAGGDASLFADLVRPIEQADAKPLPDGLRVIVSEDRPDKVTIRTVSLNADTDLPGLPAGSYSLEQLINLGFKLPTSPSRTTRPASTGYT